MPHFSGNPSVPLLQWLARGSLKQNFLRSLRLWVWLRVLYADPDDLIVEQQEIGAPSDPFTFADWRQTFFTNSHPVDEKIPPLHDPACACAKTTHEWLLLLAPELDLSDWKELLHRHDCLPAQFDAWCNQRLFGVTRRSLDEDLRVLTRLGWVQRHDQQYQRVNHFPSFPSSTAEHSKAQPLLHPDLIMIANTLAYPINGYQRFFLHVEYIVPKDATDRVDDWQAQLRQIWEQIPVPPIQLTVYSAMLDTICSVIVYPVCVYYVQRAPYLCAWGQIPGNLDHGNQAIDWRNYRLDRIHAIQPLTWNTPTIPQPLQKAYQNQTLPTPQDMQVRMSEAWGFDFYQSADTLLLRFDQDFAKRYIMTSLRHETFTSVSQTEAKALIRSKVSNPIRQKLLRLLQERSPHDAYYTAQYRRHDFNILLRLRAWRPHLEVLLPWDLRQQIGQEVMREYQLYVDMETSL